MAEPYRFRWALLGSVVTFALLGIVSFFVLLVSIAFRSGGEPSREWDETVVVDGGPRKIAMVSVEGAITSTLDPFAGGATDTEAVSQIDQALDDPDVAGIIVHLDTPGGGVVASDAINRKVREADKKKPVVALMDETAASGGYYIAAGAREIVANPATLTGSIGVIMVVPEVSEAAGKLGIEPIVIKSGPFKDIASPFRDMTPEDRAILQGVINEAYDQFVSVVAEGRSMDPARVREIADGRIYTGRQAKDLQLVDHLGDQQVALDRVRDLADAPDARLVRYGRTGLLNTLLGISAKASDGPRIVRDALGFDTSPGLKYLWKP
ncbi:MAG: signal peptide peptidase SppA [Actinomycetota bacterium]